MLFRVFVLGLLGTIVLQLSLLPRELHHALEPSAPPVEANPAVVTVSRDALEQLGAIELQLPDRKVWLVLSP